MSMSAAGGINRLILAALYPVRYLTYVTSPPARKAAAIYVLSEDSHARMRSQRASA